MTPISMFQWTVVCFLVWCVVGSQAIRQPFAARPLFAFDIVSQLNSVFSVNGERSLKLAAHLQDLKGKDNIFGCILQNLDV